MRFKIFAFLSIFFVSAQFSKAQTYYKYYQDGLIVFQLKLDAKRIVSDDKIVKFKDYPLFTDFLSDFEIIEVKQLHPDLDDELLNRTYQIKINDFSKVDEVAKVLNTHPTIEYAELKDLHYSFFTPDDQLYSTSNQWGLFKIQAEAAWDISMGSSSVIVAATDDAMQLNHPDLQNVFVTGRDMANNSSNPSPCGTNDGAHGTHVSGIIGAETNNGIGVASIGAGVSVMPVKIGNCSNEGLPYGYDGLAWASNNGAHIINMSWGSPSGGIYGQNVVNNAWNQGVILVAAAGNDGNSSLLYPAAYNNVISVANTTSADVKAGSSQFGTTIDIAAPGTNIASTVPGDGYQYMSGTSMASPMVAGLLGLMKSYAPAASRADLISCLLNSADPMPNSSHYNNNQMGSGRINAYEALICLSAYNNQYDVAVTEIISPEGTICATNFIPEIEIKNFGSTTLTSATLSYNWGGAPQTFNWTGNLSTGQTATISLPSVSVPDGSYVFTATVSSPNGQTDQNTSNNSMSSNFTMNNNGEVVTLNLNTDCWGAETTWEIRDDNNIVVASGGPYSNLASGTTNTNSLCLTKACYTFTIFDEYGDGMNGAQYTQCTVNGNYEMLDGNGDLLFNMTAPNGNFGSSASHQFCLVSNVPDDAGITEIISPLGIVCSSSFQPIVRLHNFGSDVLSSVTINYQTSGSVQTFSWTGSLASNQSQLVTLPVITSVNGQQVLSVYTTNPNGNSDGNTGNDESQIPINIQNTSSSLPFVEDFETDVFGNGKWSVENPDNSVTWERVTVGGSAPGSKAAKIDFYNYQQTGRRDGMISPKINLTGVSSATMTFDHAYKRYNQNGADSLIIYVSTDCGVNWSRVLAKAEDGTGTFATQTTSTSAFTPTNASDWCFGGTVGADCFTVNLDAFVGNHVFVKFQSFNAGAIGNNLFIDNINIDGVTVNLPPVPNMSASNNQICMGETVYITDQSTNNPTAWNWTFPGGSPATSTDQNPTVTYATNGSYDVTLQVTNAHGTQTEIFTNEIVVNSLPSVSANTADLSICEGQSTVLSGSGASSYTWSNGLGSGSNKTVSPTSTTVYTVTGTSGSCSNTATVEVEVQPAITVGLTASQTEVCPGNTTTLSASGAANYTWDNGLSAGNSQNVSPTVTTTYTVTGVDGNCTNTASITIEVKEAPVIQVTATKNAVCIGETTILTASGADSYAWSPGASLNTTSGSSVLASPIAPTTYNVMGSNICGISNQSITIGINPSPATPVIIQNGNVLSVNLQPGETVQWNFNGNFISSGASITMTQDGNYEAVVTNSNGCSSSANGNFVRDTTGLTQNDLKEQLLLYPNPTENTIIVNWKGMEALKSISVYDAIGREVLKFVEINTNELVIDLTTFETGVYVVRVNTSNNTISKKITKR